jgi:molybdopterin synthase catalytic subunit
MFAIASDSIDVEAVAASVRAPGNGGIVTFVGIVRDRADDGRAVDGLSYEAHAAMAVASFERIAQELQSRYESLRVSIVHREGTLRVGEIAVVVAVAAPHRRDAFAACAEAVDALKRDAPIWKKERYAGGSAQWRENAP